MTAHALAGDVTGPRPLDQTASRTAPRRILVGVDGSPASKAAVRWARTIAGWWSARVTLLHAAEPRPTRSSIDLCPAAALRAEDAARTTGRKVLRDALALLGRGTADAELLFGPPDRVIVRRAAELRVDLVILGSSGKGPLASIVLGDTSVAVTRRAGCSVLVVRGGAPPSAGEATPREPVAARGAAAAAAPEDRGRALPGRPADESAHPTAVAVRGQGRAAGVARRSGSGRAERTRAPLT